MDLDVLYNIRSKLHPFLTDRFFSFFEQTNGHTSTDRRRQKQYICFAGMSGVQHGNNFQCTVN